MSNKEIDAAEIDVKGCCKFMSTEEAICAGLKAAEQVREAARALEKTGGERRMVAGMVNQKKTWANIRLAIAWCKKHPGKTCLYAYSGNSAFHKEHLADALEEYGFDLSVYDYSVRECRFPNGARLLLRDESDHT